MGCHGCSTNKPGLSQVAALLTGKDKFGDRGETKTRACLERRETLRERRYFKPIASDSDIIFFEY